MTISYAVPPASPYQPGDTLDPSCVPGSANCSVEIIPDQTGNANKVFITNGTNVSWSSTITDATLVMAIIGGAAIDPTGSDGMLYYNTATDTLKAYNGSWQNLATEQYVGDNHYTKTELQTVDGSEVNWYNITNAPLIGSNTDTRLIDGGQVTYVSGYTFLVSAANYQILGTTYASPQTPITLSASDPTNDRIDVIAVDVNGDVVVIEGTPSPTPEQPYVDPVTELMLTFVNVLAGSTDPGITVIDVYKENTGPGAEWNRSSNNAALNLNSSNSPRNGTISVEGTSVSAGNMLTFSPTSSLDINATDQLVLYIKSKAVWGNNRRLSIGFQTASGQTGNAVLINRTGSFGFDSSQTASYQQIGIPISNFGVPSGTLITSMTITAVGTQGTFGFYIDDITIETGSPIVGGVSNSITTSNSSTITFSGNGLTSNPLSAGVNTTALDDLFFVQSGNTFGALSVLGTNDNFGISFETNNIEQMRINTTGAIRFNDYGTGANTGTPTYALQVDSSGNIVEGALSITPGIDSVLAVGQSLTANRSITAGANTLTISGSGSSNVLSITSGTISVPGAGSNSERFGLSTLSGGADSLAIGNGASAVEIESTAIGRLAVTGTTDAREGAVAIGYSTSANDDSVAIGSTATANFTTGVAVGWGAVAGSNSSTALGYLAATSSGQGIAIGAQATGSGAGGGGGIAIGYTSTASGANSMALGAQSSTAGDDYGIALGFNASTTASNQMVIGADDGGGSGFISNVFIGEGVTNATPLGFTLNTTGGSGTNIAGANIGIASGKATGNASAGSIIFQTSDAGASGTTLQSLTTKALIDPTGILAVGRTSSFGATRLDVMDNAIGANNIVNISSTSTAAASNLQKALNISLSGANSTSTQSTYGIYVSNTHTGTSSTNYGIYATATGGTTNRAIYADTSGGSGTAVYATNSSSGWGVYGETSTGYGVQGISGSSGYGVWAESNTGPAFYAQSTARSANGPVAEIFGNWSSTSSNERILYLERGSSGTPADGISGSIDIWVETTTSLTAANRIVSKWATATHSSRTSEFSIQGVNNGGSLTTLLTINGAGELLVGTTADSGNFKLQIDGGVSLYGLTVAGSSQDALCIVNGGTEVQRNNGAQTCTVSSERFKHNIQPLDEDGLSIITEFKPSTFIYNGQDNIRTGLIAEEVVEVDERFVFYEADGVTPRGVRYEDLVALSIKGIQELDVKITNIEDFESDADDSFVGNLRAWLANASNRITRIFTGEICLTDPDGTTECLNRSELSQLKQLLNGQPNSQIDENLPAPEQSEQPVSDTNSDIPTDSVAEENTEQENISPQDSTDTQTNEGQDSLETDEPTEPNASE